MELNRNLQQALEAHRRMLNKHLKIWKKAQAQNLQDGSIIAAAKSCQERTEQMLEQCSSIDFLKLADGTNTAVSKKHKRSDSGEDSTKSKKARRTAENENETPSDPPVTTNGQRIPVTKDPSGLFLIDSNPEDVDVLMKQSQDQQKNQRKPKRGHQLDTGEELVDVPLEVKDPDHEQPIPKRKKAKHSEPVKEPANDADEYAQHLEQKVALRLKEKELVNQEKANKKRKRESDMSLAESQGDADVDVESSTTRPVSKKRKAKASVAEQPDPSKNEKGVKRKTRSQTDATLANEVPQPKSKKKKVKSSG